METEVDKEILKSAGAELLPDGRQGLRIHDWEIETIRGTILTSLAHEQYSISISLSLWCLWEEKLKTSHLPEMVFGENALVLKHLSSNTKIHFNAFDALAGWKQEGLPPVEVPAAAQWKFRSKPSQQVILDYDYTFTTPYCGSGVVEKDQDTVEAKASHEGMLVLSGRAVKSRLIWLLSHLKNLFSSMMRESCQVHGSSSYDFGHPQFFVKAVGETTFKSLSAKGYPVDLAFYSDPGPISQRLPVIKQITQKLKIPRKV
ncbi:hypothetical protein Bca52824_093910 [Brassica carinata]|uniref:Uncharacterized protein n=1 Tax=Brassica carinata TaxID=52824 RepID=A0A8X7TKA2_BRACI|nr:hypothetical protein Bca52824_093910 [Brassica carinata]